MGTSVIHIKSEIECAVFLFDEEKGIATPGKWFNLVVRKGEQDLLFVSTWNGNSQYHLLYQVDDSDCDYNIVIPRDSFTLYSPTFLQRLDLAKQGNPTSQFNVGLQYEKGDGVKQDLQEAVNWFRKAADQGYRKAQLRLGILYANGKGVEKDYKEAVKWFQLAGEQGSFDAQCCLGFCYLNGLGVYKNELEAIRLFRIVATQTSLKSAEKAQHKIEECFLNGIGVKEYPSDAIQIFQQEHLRDDSRTQYQLGICYKDGIGVEKNITKAIDLFRKSANQDNAKAQNELGLCYKQGLGVMESNREAFEWFLKSAKLGNPEGQCNLGYCYYFAKGTYEDYHKARYWFEKSANQGNAYAQYCMGMGYRRGDWGKENHKVNYEEATRWARLSAEQGYAPAQTDLANSYYCGWVVQNYIEAVKWYKKAAEQKDETAQYYLAKCYCNGTGVTKDYTMAAYWMQKAAENGHAEAKAQCANYPYSIKLGTFDIKEQSASKNNLECYYLFFDTETTGVPRNYNAPASDMENWPRLIQLGWILTDSNGKTLSSGNEIVRPDGFTIPPSAEKVHGISTGKAILEGIPIRNVIDSFLKDAKRAKYFVGHNISFDQNVVGAELHRLGIPDIISKAKSICTMQASTDFCKIPDTYGYKWPKLQELYRKLFGTNFEDAHDAMADVKATKKCFFELKRLGVIK